VVNDYLDWAGRVFEGVRGGGGENGGFHRCRELKSEENSQITMAARCDLKGIVLGLRRGGG
jgi:hypothetical protein